jgi:hypothetical protein
MMLDLLRLLVVPRLAIGGANRGPLAKARRISYSRFRILLIIQLIARDHSRDSGDGSSPKTRHISPKLTLFVVILEHKSSYFFAFLRFHSWHCSKKREEAKAPSPVKVKL